MQEHQFAKTYPGIMDILSSPFAISAQITSKLIYNFLQKSSVDTFLPISENNTLGQAIKCLKFNNLMKVKYFV